LFIDIKRIKKDTLKFTYKIKKRMNNSKTVLVIGGAGFIGSNLVPELVNHGFNVIVLDAFVKYGKCIGIQKNVMNHKNVELIFGDMMDKEIIKKALQKSNSVIHLASLSDIPFSTNNPKLVTTINCVGLLTLLEECKKKDDLEKFILLSSESIYSRESTGSTINEAHPIDPPNIYGITKSFQDFLVQSYHNQYGLPSTILRSALVFGDRQQDKAIISFIKKALKNQDITIEGGKQIRDTYHVSNIVHAILLSLKNTESNGEIYNVSGEFQISIENLAKKIIEFTSSKSKLCYGDYRKGDSEKIQFHLDISKIKNQLKYEPITSFDEGLKRTIHWIEKNPNWYSE